MSADINELRRRMEGALKSLHTEFSGLRTGRANASLLDNIQVVAYGRIKERSKPLKKRLTRQALA